MLSSLNRPQDIVTTDANSDGDGEGHGLGEGEGGNEKSKDMKDDGDGTADAKDITAVTKKSSGNSGDIVVRAASADGVGTKKGSDGEEMMEGSDQAPPEESAHEEGKKTEDAQDPERAAKSSLGLEGTNLRLSCEGKEDGKTEGEVEGENKGGSGDCTEGSTKNRGDSESVNVTSPQEQVVSGRRGGGKEEGEAEGGVGGETEGHHGAKDGNDCNEESTHNRDDSEQGSTRRRSSRIKSLPVPMYTYPSFEVKNSSSISRNPAQKRKRENVIDDSESAASNQPPKKPKIEGEETNKNVGPGWTRGSYTYKKSGGIRTSWISPTRKIEFKYRKDAMLFDSLRTKHNGDEKKAWIGYTKIKNTERYTRREVVDSDRHDEEMGVDPSLVRLTNVAENVVGEGWDVERDEKRSNSHKIYYISPTRKMKFRYRKDAVIFESLRKQYGTDEVQAWAEYTKYKSSRHENREVINSNQFDDCIGDVEIIRRNEDPPGPGWVFSRRVLKNGREDGKGVWTSPTRKMRFRNRKDAVLFESLRMKYGTDEIQAWAEYTNIKRSKHERREVQDSYQYDVVDGSKTHHGTKEEHALPGAKPQSTLEKKDSSSNSTDADGVMNKSVKLTRRSLPLRIQPRRSGKVLQSYDEDFTLKEEEEEDFKPEQRKLQLSSSTEQKTNPSNEKNKDDNVPNEGKDMNQAKKALPTPSLRTSSRVQRKRRSVEITNKEESSEDKQQHNRRSLPLPVRTLRVRKRASLEEVTSSKDHKVANKPEKAQPRISTRVSPRRSANEPSTRFTSLSMNDLSHIASFLSTFEDLTSFCLTSKQMNTALATYAPAEPYRTLFLKEFGVDLSDDGDMNINWTWKERWTKLRSLKRGFHREETATIIQSSVGVLRWEKEEAALFEDNPQIAPVDREISRGYFGLQALNNLIKPPNASLSWEPPILLHGDFDGIKIYDSARGLLSGKRRAYETMGEDFGQVTSLVICKFTGKSDEDKPNPPCCFLGYASGVVATLTAKLTEDENAYHFSIGRHTNAHKSKVTAMTVVSCRPKKNHSPVSILLSAGYDGQVFYYPDAMNKNNHYDMNCVFAFSNSHPDICPVISMTSTSIIQENESSILICTGDRNGSVKLWLSQNDLIADIKPSSDDMFDQVKWYKSKGRHTVTITKFLSPRVLMSGNNQGDIRVWEVEFMKESPTDDNSYSPGLNLRYFLKCAHNGPVETCMSIGDIIITSGGNHGSLVTWDVASGKKIGDLSCHEGQETFDHTTGAKGVVKSCPVGAIIVNNRLISLCRDGVLAEWLFC